MCLKNRSFLRKTVTECHWKGNRCLQANDEKNCRYAHVFRRIRQLFCTVGTLFLIRFLRLPPLIPRVSNFAKMREEGGGVLLGGAGDMNKDHPPGACADRTSGIQSRLAHI